MPAELAELAHSINAMLGRLDDAFQRLSAFSADIAHELRTPLSNLLTHTQVTLTRERPLEDYREALHSNLEELQWMAQLVNDMLYLAKADHGLLALNREPLQLAEEVDALLDFFAPLAEDANVRLSREGESRIEGDRNMLRRALSNLLDNALRFTPIDGEVRVRIIDEAQGVNISVENSGEGLQRICCRACSTASTAPTRPARRAAANTRGSDWPSPARSSAPTAGRSAVSRPMVGRDS